MKWILQKRFRNLYEKKFDLRGRCGKTPTKDIIHRACFVSTLLQNGFEDEDLKKGVKYGIIKKDQIRLAHGEIRTIYLWLEEECEYQPTWYKRWYQNVIKYFKGWL